MARNSKRSRHFNQAHMAFALALPLSFGQPGEEACGDTTEPTADDLLALTQNCDPLPGVGYFSNDYGGSNTIPMCELDGAIWFRADMDIDCDGGTEAECKADPYYLPETSANDSNGDPLDASHLPFSVLPLNSNGFSMSEWGLRLGSTTAVIYQGQLLYMPLGDRGPSGTVGEASYAAAVDLGIPPSPISGGVPSGVTYIFFDGSDAVVSPIESESAAASVGSTQAADLLLAN